MITRGAYSDCCYESCQSSGSTFASLFSPIKVCGDCTRGTPFCARGKCNIFGCNCDNGCRKGLCQAKAACLKKLTDFVHQDKQG
uniref:Uncharacterized protein n=1 Tax=Romanomermis culicivorax TaxID=13658 RepID=A0A915IGN9_ROMCU